MKKKIRFLAGSLAVIAVSASIITGSTYALFTSESEVNIAVSSAKVDVKATIGDVSATHVSEVNAEGEEVRKDGLFSQEAVSFENGVLALNNVTPGDKVSFTITVENNSTVNMKYRTKITCAEDNGLMDGLVFNLGDEDYSGLVSYVSTWEVWNETGTKTVEASIELPYETGNKYQGLSCKIAYVVEAVQGNGSTDDSESGLVVAKKVANKEDLGKAISEGGYIKLEDDIELDGTYYAVIQNDTVIDLGGKTLKSYTAFSYAPLTVANGGSLTFKNGNLDMERSKTTQCVIAVNKDSSLYMDGVTLSTNGYGIFPAGDAASVIIKNSKLVSTGAATISTNANSVDNYGVIITVEDSILIGNTGLLVNVPATVSIENTTIEASMQGIIARGGTFTIKDSKLANTSDDPWAATYFDTRIWGDGNTVNLAALTIGNKGGNSYQYPTEVILINTVVESVGVYPVVYMYGNTTEGNGATLKYDGNCTFRYTSECALDYIIQGDNGANTTVVALNK